MEARTQVGRPRGAGPWQDPLAVPGLPGQSPSVPLSRRADTVGRDSGFREKRWGHAYVSFRLRGLQAPPPLPPTSPASDVRRRPGRKQELYPSHSVPGMAAVLRAVCRMRPSQRRKFSSCLRAQREGRNTASISEEIIQPQLAFIRHLLGARLCAELHTDRFT